MQLALITVNKMRIVQAQREQQAQRILEAIQSNTQLLDRQAEEEITRISSQNDSLRRLLSLQRVVDEFIEDIKAQSEAAGGGLLYFEEFHLKLLSFLHVLVPNCKRMQLFLSRDAQG
jgi:hypothetical protein